MADNPFDITPIGFLEKPVSKDHNQNASQMQRTIREVVRVLTGVRTAHASPAAKSISGFFGDGFRVVPSSPAALSFQVTPGMGFIYAPADVPTEIGSPDIQELDDLSTYKPVVLLNPATFNITVPSGVNSRIDIVEVKVDRRLENLVARRKFDEDAEAFVAHSYYKTLAYTLDGRTGQVASPANSTAGLSYKVGVEGVAPVAPATSPGYVKLAEIRSASGTVTVTGSLISDVRKFLTGSGMLTASIRARLQWSAGAQTVTVLSIKAPPGVELGMRGRAGQRGAIDVACLAGDMTGAAVHATVESDQNLGVASVQLRHRNVTGLFHGPVLSAEQSILQAMTPSLLTGFATNRVLAGFDTVFLDANGTATQSVELEDMIWNVTFQLGYH